MPRGSDYPGSPEDLEAYRDLVDRHPEDEVLGAKNPYSSRNGWMTSFLDPTGLICLRLSPDDRAAVIDAGSAAVKQYEKNMPDFASVPPAAADAELDALFAQSWDHVGNPGTEVGPGRDLALGQPDRPRTPATSDWAASWTARRWSAPRKLSP